MQNEKLVKNGHGFITEDGEYTVTPVDRDTVGWIRGDRFHVDVRKAAFGEDWTGVKNLKEATAWIEKHRASEKTTAKA